VEEYYKWYMSLKFTSIIKKEGNYFVARSVPLGVVSQGKSLDEANSNLKEAVELYLENTKVDKSEFKGYSYVSSFDVVV
jgi:predicted RNase H-like HicB family nuclease